MARYLLAVDGSEYSDRAYDLLATKMLHPDRDELTIVSIISKKTHDTMKRQRTDDLLKKYDLRTKNAGLKVDTLLVEGDSTRDALIDLVDRLRPDVLVLGTRGLSGIKKMVMGSVTSYCVNNANCNVLVVK